LTHAATRNVDPGRGGREFMRSRGGFSARDTAVRPCSQMSSETLLCFAQSLARVLNREEGGTLEPWTYIFAPDSWRLFTQEPTYYVANEDRLLIIDKVAPRLSQLYPDVTCFVSAGSGTDWAVNGKDRVMVEAMNRARKPNQRGITDYCAVDLSGHLLNQAFKAACSGMSGVKVHRRQADFTTGLTPQGRAMRPLPGRKRLAVCSGITITNPPGLVGCDMPINSMATMVSGLAGVITTSNNAGGIVVTADRNRGPSAVNCYADSEHWRRMQMSLIEAANKYLHINGYFDQRVWSYEPVDNLSSTGLTHHCLVADRDQCGTITVPGQEHEPIYFEVPKHTPVATFNTARPDESDMRRIADVANGMFRGRISVLAVMPDAPERLFAVAMTVNPT